MALQWQVDRSELSRTRLVEVSAPPRAPGTAVLQVERFAVTANNVTYAVLGEELQYWRCFPADAGWGIVPAWGFAHVVSSASPDARVGERFYGLVPMASHLIVAPSGSTPAAIIDVSAHRAGLPRVYQWYQRVPPPASEASDDEDRWALLRPVFLLSFLLAAALEREDYFGADTVLVSSASSKAAIGLASCLKQQSTIRVVALTSAVSSGFVQSLGLYDNVVEYDEIGRLPRAVPTYIDFSGAEPLRLRVLERYGQALRPGLRVGGTGQRQPWTAGRFADEPGHVLFSAPDAMVALTARWGRLAFEQRLEQAWQPFLEGSRHWLRVQEWSGLPSMDAIWRSHLTGSASPAVGAVCVVQ